MRGGLDGRAGRRPPESLELIKALLAAGANPNAQLAFKEPSRGGRDNRFRDDLLTTGATPLLLRQRRPSTTTSCGLLLERGALVDLPNASGVTPFMAAAGVGTRHRRWCARAGVSHNVISALAGDDGRSCDRRARM